MQPNRQKASLELLEKLGKPFPAMRKARFAKFYDYDNNKFFDFYLNQGSVVLGYSSSVLSRALKNTLSRGFLHYSPSHLEHQAKKSVAAAIDRNKKAYFFYSMENMLHALEKKSIQIQWDDFLHQKNQEGLMFSQWTLRAELKKQYPMIVLSPAIANGLPVYALLSDKALELEEDSLSPLHYQAVITTLSEMDKNKGEKTYQRLIGPYKNEIIDYGGGIFQVKGFEFTENNVKSLREKCIYIQEGQDYFFLCAQTEEHQMAYLMKSIQKI